MYSKIPEINLVGLKAPGISCSIKSTQSSPTEHGNNTEVITPLMHEQPLSLTEWKNHKIQYKPMFKSIQATWHVDD